MTINNDAKKDHFRTQKIAFFNRLQEIFLKEFILFILPFFLLTN